MMEQIKSSLVVERTYKADIEDVWELWTTKEGFESWWGPQQFRVEVHTIEACRGGALQYDMIAATPEAIAAMENMGAPVLQPCRGSFSEFMPHERLKLTQVIDFLPGVAPYDSTIAVDFVSAAEDSVRMVVTLSQMHDAATTRMQREGFTSQLAKLDHRYGWSGVQQLLGVPTGKPIGVADGDIVVDHALGGDVPGASSLAEDE